MNCQFCGKKMDVTRSCCDKQFWLARSCKKCHKPTRDNIRWGIDDVCECTEPPNAEG